MLVAPVARRVARSACRALHHRPKAVSEDCRKDASSCAMGASRCVRAHRSRRILPGYRPHRRYSSAAARAYLVSRSSQRSFRSRPLRTRAGPVAAPGGAAPIRGGPQVARKSFGMPISTRHPCSQARGAFRTHQPPDTAGGIRACDAMDRADRRSRCGSAGEGTECRCDPQAGLLDPRGFRPDRSRVRTWRPAPDGLPGPTIAASGGGGPSAPQRAAGRARNALGAFDQSLEARWPVAS